MEPTFSATFSSMIKVFHAHGQTQFWLSFDMKMILGDLYTWQIQREVIKLSRSVEFYEVFMTLLQDKCCFLSLDDFCEKWWAK